MACPQCGTEVPPDDSFCGKCGYAMREGTPERLDQSRIRVHEGPDPVETPPAEPSKSRRKGTMVGMPAVTPSKSPSPGTEMPPPTEISAARERAKKRTPQKTMLGIPRPELAPPPTPPDLSGPSGDTASPADAVSRAPESLGDEGSARPPRARAHVRYDSINESFAMVQRRKKALRWLVVLVLLAGAWFAYRFLANNG